MRRSPRMEASTVIETISPFPFATQRTSPPPVSPVTVLPPRVSRTRATSSWMRRAVSRRPLMSGKDITAS